MTEDVGKVKRVRFEIIPDNDPRVKDHFGRWADGCRHCIMDYDESVNGELKIIATDCGEPEDNSFYRDYAWIVPLLNQMEQEAIDAYKLGYKEAKEKYAQSTDGEAEEEGVGGVSC